MQEDIFYSFASAAGAASIRACQLQLTLTDNQNDAVFKSFAPNCPASDEAGYA